ncbi:MAG TPA: tetratricopeptide repeat protein [Thermoanaerobaculia bacterium]|nr:tetratricopeptide repeat protein [Thermoanaerobaculia bacterium]
MKIHKTALLLAFLSACSPGDSPAGAEQEPPPADPAQPSVQAPVQGPTLDMTKGQGQVQEPAEEEQAGAPAAPKRPLTPAETRFQEALALIEKGDAAGTIRILEALRQEKQATPPMLSLLGAVYLQEKRAKDALDVLRPLADSQETDPALLYNAGRAALALGQAEVGQRYLERSVSKMPLSPAGRELGLLLSRQGRIIEAYRLLRPWALRDNDLETKIIGANLALRLERPAEAEEILSGLPEKEPAIQLLRAQARIQRGDGKAALALLQPLEKNHPASFDLEVRRSLAEAHLVAGNPAAALQVLQGHTGNHPSLILLAAKAQRQSGNAQAAMTTLKPLVDQIPADGKVVGDPRPAAGVAVEYGRLLLGSGNAANIAGAVSLLEKATRLHPGSREAWEVYAEALTAAGRAQDAAQAKQKAKEIADAATAPAPAPARPAQQAEALTPNLIEAERLLAGGDSEKALAAARREIAANPSSVRGRAMEVQILLRLKRFPEALKAADAAVQADPKNPDFIYQRGAVQIGMRKLSEAEKDLSKALEMAPRHTPAMNDLAVVKMLQNKPAEAQKLLEQVLAINPNDQNAKASLENLKKMASAKGKG